MNNKFIFLLCNFFINNWIILKVKYIKYKNLNYNYDFHNINFDDYEDLKKILFSKKYFKNLYYDEKSYNYHTFSWLKAAKKIGGAKTISLAKQQIINWSDKKYNIYSFVWNNEFVAKRLINLIYNFDFYAVSANADEKEAFRKIILKHYFILSLQNKLRNNQEATTIEIHKALLLMHLINNLQTINIFKQINNQLLLDVNIDGFHKSLNPTKHGEYINDLNEIKNMCLFFDRSIPESMEYQLINMVSVLKNLFHRDQTISLFNGSNNANNESLIKISNLYKDIKLKNLSKIKNGIAILEWDKLKIFFDVAKPTNKYLNKDLHSGTLGFEMSYDKEKIFTNCGSIEKRIGKKPEYLRFSAAHSTIIINNTNISELVEKKSYKRIPEFILLNYDENEDSMMWEGSHDGYKKNFNNIIKRKIIIYKKNQRIYGRDIIISTKKQNKKNFFNVRFHLTPLCRCLLTNNQKAVFIKTDLNQSWIFKSENKLSLEDSIHVNDGKKINKTKQIVISGYCSEPKRIIQWSITKNK